MRKSLLSACALLLASNAYAGIAGTYQTTVFKAYDYEGYAVAKEVSWSNEDTEAWEVTITENEDGTYSIYNLVDWESTITATYNEADGTLVIPARTIIDEENGYALTGSKYGIDDLLTKLNSAGSWVLSSICADLKLEVKGNTITALNPMFIYISDTSYDSYTGYICEGYGNVYSEYAIEAVSGGEQDGVRDIVTNNNAKVEYYNLQGMRLNNPTPGQIVIKRQGNQAVKMIVR